MFLKTLPKTSYHFSNNLITQGDALNLKIRFIFVMDLMTSLCKHVLSVGCQGERKTSCPS